MENEMPIEMEKLRTTIAEMEKSDVERTAKYETLKQEVLFYPQFLASLKQ